MYFVLPFFNNPLQRHLAQQVTNGFYNHTSINQYNRLQLILLGPDIESLSLP